MTTWSKAAGDALTLDEKYVFTLVQLVQQLGLVPGLSLGLCHGNVPGSAPVGNAALGLCPGHYTLIASEINEYIQNMP